MIELKIGRHTYKITEEDRFMDNGSCVQLLTQSKEKANWMTRPAPALSKILAKRLAKLKRKVYKHNYGSNVIVYSLVDI